MSRARRHDLKKDFEQFFRGYVDYALWLSTDDESEPLDKNYDKSDITPSSLRAMKRDCALFFKRNRNDLVEYCNHVVRRDRSYSCMEYAGHDFWKTANGAGSGFWDRDGVGESGRPEGPPGLGERLSSAAKEFASDLYVGDDRRVYVSPEN